MLVSSYLLLLLFDAEVLNKTANNQDSLIESHKFSSAGRFKIGKAVAKASQHPHTTTPLMVETTNTTKIANSAFGITLIII